MIGGSLGLRFVASVLHADDLAALVRFGSVDNLLRDDERPALAYVQQHVTQFGILPTVETVQTHTSLALPKVTEPPAYYHEHLRLRFIETELRAAVKRAGHHLGPMNKDPIAALQALATSVCDLVIVGRQGEVLDFRQSYTPVLTAYSAQAKSGGLFGIPLGWPYLDDLMGGIQPGDLISFVGRPQKGKTWMLVYAAHHAWRAHSKRVLFVSMEMLPLRIEQRLAALHTKVPAMDLKLGRLTTAPQGGTLGKLKTGLHALPKAEAPFYVVGRSASPMVHDLVLLARQLKPDVVYIDGAYLLRHPDTHLNKFRRIGEVTEQLKQDLADALRIPVVCTWQFNRESTKKKKDEPVGLEDIAYADEIGQISSTVLGLFQPETVETTDRKLVEVLKGREGERGQFWINWNFQSMVFDQWREKKQEAAPEEEPDTEVL